MSTSSLKYIITYLAILEKKNNGLLKGITIVQLGKYAEVVVAHSLPKVLESG